MLTIVDQIASVITAAVTVADPYKPRAGILSTLQSTTRHSTVATS